MLSNMMKSILEQERIDIIDKMVEHINSKIRYTQENYTEWNEIHSIKIAEINGMIDMLSIVTEKNYVITENGLEEI